MGKVPEREAGISYVVIQSGHEILTKSGDRDGGRVWPQINWN